MTHQTPAEEAAALRAPVTDEAVVEVAHSFASRTATVPAVWFDFTAAIAPLIRAAERERCAKVCEDERVDTDATHASEDVAYNQACADCAAAIRSAT